MNRSRRPAPSVSLAVQSFARELQIFAGKLSEASTNNLMALLEPVFESVPSSPSPLSAWIIRALLVNVLHRIDAHFGRPPSSSEMELLWQADSKQMMCDLLHQHVIDLDNSRTSRVPTSCGDSRIDRALDYMREHCSRSSLALDEVCAFVRLSRWHFGRLFTKCLGMTFRDAIRHLRMERATTLLNEHLLSIKEIAAHLGFVHPTEFDRQFKQSFNMTPTEWRARHASATSRSA